ncbi:MAG: hypothetical protein ABW044_07835, partial [Cellvibrio sp.]
MNTFFLAKKSLSLHIITAILTLSACTEKEKPAPVTHLVAAAPKMTVDEFIDDANKKLDVATR